MLETIRNYSQILRDAGIETFRRDVEQLICFVLECTREALLIQSEDSLSEVQRNQIEKLIHRRVVGEPVAYLIGRAPFYGRDFVVDNNVLIPRWETELLIELVKEKVPRGELVLEIGSGSGCVATTLALLGYKVVAVEKSLEACQIIEENLKLHGVQASVELVCADIETSDCGFKNKFSAIVSNPPYISLSDTEVTPSVKNFEPHMALFAGESGLEKYETWLSVALSHIMPAGLVAFEIGHKQGLSVKEIFNQFGFSDVEVIQDLAHNDRVVVGKG